MTKKVLLGKSCYIAAKLTALNESLRSPAEDMTKSVVEELQKVIKDNDRRVT